MKNELKTLEDLESTDRWEDNIARWRLKQNAIKHIKYFQKLLDALPEYNKRYLHKNKEGKELPEEAMEGVYKGKIDYIKWANNLTEEDLK